MRLHDGLRTAAGLLVSFAAGTACGYDPDDYGLSPSHVDDVLALAVLDSVNGEPVGSLPADGFSRVTLVATIDREADASRRTINFSTTAGMLVGGTGSAAAQSVVTDANGVAAVDLVSGTLVQDVRLRAEVKDVGGVAKELALQFTAVSPDSVLRFVDVPANLPADQSTVGTIMLRISDRLPASQRSVNASTTLGQIVQTSPITPLADKTLRIDLRAPGSTGTARIQVSVNGFARDTTVMFGPALPDLILLDAGSFNLALGSETTVRARLLRITGVPTAGTIVDFVARDQAGNAVGQFRSIQPSDSKGEATAIFTPSGVNAPADLTLEASVSGSTAVGHTGLHVTP
jgi:hypothetical protein